MIGMRTILEVADNSGALGSHKFRRGAATWDCAPTRRDHGRSEGSVAGIGHQKKEAGAMRHRPDAQGDAVAPRRPRAGRRTSGGTGHRARTWNYQLNITSGLILQFGSLLCVRPRVARPQGAAHSGADDVEIVTAPLRSRSRFEALLWASPNISTSARSA